MSSQNKEVAQSTMERFGQLSADKQQWIIEQVGQSVDQRSQPVISLAGETPTAPDAGSDATKPKLDGMKGEKRMAMEKKKAQKNAAIKKNKIKQEVMGQKDGEKMKELKEKGREKFEKFQNEQKDKTKQRKAEARHNRDQNKQLNNPPQEEEKVPEQNTQGGLIDYTGMNKIERKLAKEIERQQRGRSQTTEDGWTQIDQAEVIRVQRAIQQQTGSNVMPTPEDFANFFNSHEIDATGHITNMELQTPEQMEQAVGLPSNNESNSMNGYFVGFAAAAVVMYYLKKRNSIDEDTLFQRQKDPRSSLMDYIRNPFGKKDDNDDFDEMI